MSQEQQQNLPTHSDENNDDVDLAISAKTQPIVEEEEERADMHSPQEIVTAGMDHKDIQIRQLQQKVAFLENENNEMRGEINQLRNKLAQREEVKLGISQIMLKFDGQFLLISQKYVQKC